MLRDQICTRSGPKVDSVTFDERVIVHRMVGRGFRRTGRSGRILQSSAAALGFQPHGGVRGVRWLRFLNVT